MKKSIILCSIIAIVIIAVSCKKNTDSGSPSSTTAYLDLPAKTYSYYTLSQSNTKSPVLVDSANRVATLGRVLFYDTHLSINNAISCGSCHKQEFAFADNSILSSGYEFMPTKRNSPPIQNLSPNMFITPTGLLGGTQNLVLFWDGRERNVQNLITRPISNHVEMGISDLTTLPAKLSALPYYGKLFTAAFGSTDISVDKITLAVAAFICSINSNSSRFSKAIGTTDSLGLFHLNANTSILNGLTALEQQGYNLFMTKYNCGNCHHIITNTYALQQSFMDTGLDDSYSDLGRGAITLSSSDNGKFKVPSLHNVAVTAPYMHDGRFKTLDEVLDHYSHGISNSANLSDSLKNPITMQPMQMNISTDEKQAIIAFLNTFTDNDMITDPKFSNPFKVK